MDDIASGMHEHDLHHRHANQQKTDRAEQIAPSQQSPEGPQNTGVYPTSLLGSARLNSRGNGPVRVALMQQMQQTYGNRAVQRFLEGLKGTTNHSYEITITDDAQPVQRMLQDEAIHEKAEAVPEVTHVHQTNSWTNHSRSAPSSQPHIQRYIKGDKNGKIRKKIEDSATYKGYNAYEKKIVDGWMNDKATPYDVSGIKDLDALLKEEKAKFEPDFLATLELKDLEKALEAEKLKPFDSLTTLQLDRIRNEILRRKKSTGPVPQGHVIRDPSLTQPNPGTSTLFVPNSGELGTRTTRSGKEGKDWKKIGDSKGKSAAAEELNTKTRTIPNMVWTDTGGTEQALCPACGRALSMDKYHTDHQIAFETLKKKAWELADYISLSPKHEAEVKTQYAEFDKYFVKDLESNWAPTNRMLSDYSNDMYNLFRICGTCNSMIGGKGTDSIEDWFKAAPLFGTAFITWAKSNHGPVKEDFFGNPTVGIGWGLAAFEWVQKMIGKFSYLLKAQEQRHPKRMANLIGSTTELEEAEEEKKTKGPTPATEKRVKKARSESQKHRLSVKVGLGVEEKLSEKTKMSEYDTGYGSDEEKVAKDLVEAVSEKYEKREERKRRKKRTYSVHLENRVQDDTAPPAKKSKATDLAEEDARERVKTIKLMALHSVLGIGYTGKPLEGTTPHDGTIGNQAKAEYQKQIDDLISKAKEAGANKMAPPAVPMITGITLELYSVLQQKVSAAYYEGLQVHFKT